MAGFLLKVLEWLTKPSHPVFLLFHYPPSRRLSGKESACQCRRRKRRGFNPWVGKVPCGRKWQSISVSLPGNPMNRGAWRATVHGVTQSQTGLSSPTPTSSLFHLRSGFHRSFFLNWHAGLWPFSLSFIKHTHYDPPLCKVFWWWFHCLQTNIQTGKPLNNYSPCHCPTWSPTILYQWHSITSHRYPDTFTSVCLCTSCLLYWEYVLILSSSFKLNASSGEQRLWTSPNWVQVLAFHLWTVLSRASSGSHLPSSELLTISVCVCVSHSVTSDPLRPTDCSPRGSRPSEIWQSRSPIFCF